MTLLVTRGLTREFGGLHAVENVDFTLDEGEIRAIIGPNGAGKTTFVSLICGRIRPSAGEVLFKQEDISALPAHERVQRGIAYMFQITSVFANLSVFDNVALAAQNSRHRHDWQAHTVATIASVGLSDRREAKAATLAYGHQRLLELAMGLALDPSLLILDEPTQGLSDPEIRQFCSLVRETAARVTVLIIEHNMDVVMGLAQRITVFDRGRILAEGTPDEIRSSDDVQRVYLGGEGASVLWWEQAAMLKMRGISCFYGNVQVLHDFSLTLAAGEVLCLLGRNGAGKTTALKAIMGLVRPRSGRIEMDGMDLTQMAPHEVPRQGIGYVPQGRRLFSELTVAENLDIGLMARKSSRDALNRAISMFPVLGERLNQRSGSLSGGEQQMLAMARALCLEPRVLLLDEPTEGLMPAMIAKIRQVVAALRDQRVGTILVEQRVDAVLPVADRVAFIENGRLRETVPVSALKGDLSLVHRYVGMG